ncbi:MAG: hypothetical protein PHX68_02040 [Alphaproteobacteria bacterium]|nr:hypothetical protein [Alphaproteobacteria bacterium]
MFLKKWIVVGGIVGMVASPAAAVYPVLDVPQGAVMIADVIAVLAGMPTQKKKSKQLDKMSNKMPITARPVLWDEYALSERMNTPSSSEVVVTDTKTPTYDKEYYEKVKEQLIPPADAEGRLNMTDAQVGEMREKQQVNLEETAAEGLSRALAARTVSASLADGGKTGSLSTYKKQLGDMNSEESSILFLAGTMLGVASDINNMSTVASGMLLNMSSKTISKTLDQ